MSGSRPAAKRASRAPAEAIKNRLLSRVEAEIASATHQTQSACARARRALLLARHGRMDQARSELTALHQLAFQHPHPELGAWLHFAEGLMSYYTDFSSAAHEKIARAQQIARAAGLPALEALCAAWLAQLAYVRHVSDEMLRQAELCDRLAALDDHGARYRLCTVMGLAHQYADLNEPALVWFSQARRHALTDGDDASVSALMYNMAEMRTAQARRASLRAALAAVSGGQGLLLGADSIKHYDAAMGGSVMPDLTPLLRAQILVVEGDFAQALALYEAHLPQAMASGLTRLGSSLLADLAWCRVNLGQLEQGALQARESEFELDAHCDVDDRAATHSRLAQVYASLGQQDAARQQAAQAQAAWQEFADQQAAWARQLQPGVIQPR